MARPVIQDGDEEISLLVFNGDGDGDRSWQLNFDDFQHTVELTVTSSAPINTYYTHLLASPVTLKIQIYGFDTLSLSLRSNSPFEGGFVGNQIVERLRVLRRLRQGGFSRAAPRNQSRRGFLKPLILLSFLFFEMEETVLIGYLILKVERNDAKD
ncbi:hypothetical protein F2Q68_00028148 [Brassica cretica]|uniref:Uncharacterized protein n=1 Tax=Brassica cretica TaxID=69181 RepID=A0A8S9I939_BRACR|nr:hypothetical protein F2Q68_00028148 [Brassica cretica]